MRQVFNPPNPWKSESVELLEPAPLGPVEVFEVQARSVLSPNKSPDLSFSHSVNPYRGCAHACAYCYARPSHHQLELGAGTDFDRKLVVKVNAAQRLREAFMRRSWKGEVIALSGNTDCYQPLEASYGLTRQLLELCLEFRNPVDLITKSALIERDLPLLAALHAEAGVRVAVSVPFADEAMSRALEPGAPGPGRRLKTLARLVEAGVPAGVIVAPIIPGLSDDQIPAILEGAAAAGAHFASYTLLRLAPEVEAVFTARLEASYPLRAAKVLSTLRDTRGGEIDTQGFGARMRGQGPRWQLIAQLFRQHARRLGLDRPDPDPGRRDRFRRPERQLSLFDPGGG